MEGVSMSNEHSNQSVKREAKTLAYDFKKAWQMTKMRVVK